MPRAYPFLRFATTLATVLLFFTFGLNFLAPQMAAAPGFGMGGGGSGADLFSSEQAQEPSIAAAPTEAPAATEAPSAEILPMPTQIPTLEPESERNAVPPTEKIDATGNADAQDQSQVANEFPVPVSIRWQLVLAGVALLGALLMLLMRQSAFQRWRQK